jgi:histidine phosphotransferase ChpT
MPVSVDLRVLELLNSRLCHELISPVGAINNGIELMEEDDADFAKDAMKLVASSARTAGNRLNFYRFAYGSGRGASGREAALGVLEGGKVKGEWGEAANALGVEWQRLACNMLLLAAEALPRGGTVEVLPAAGGKTGIVVNASGDTTNVHAEVRTVLAGTATVDDLTARSVHAYYTQRVAEALGANITMTEPQPGKLVFAAG